MYTHGHGVPQDIKQAVGWYKKSAEQGNPSAQLNLGVMYYSGQGVPKDPRQALKYLQSSAQQGNGHAQFDLATLYTQADGIQQDLPRALIWFAAAAVNLSGNEAKIADENSKAVAAKMTPAQLAAAKQMSGKCKAGDYKACD
jgi:TPR repeat protein